jgi:hypothetical protein
VFTRSVIAAAGVPTSPEGVLFLDADGDQDVDLVAADAKGNLLGLFFGMH